MGLTPSSKNTEFLYVCIIGERRRERERKETNLCTHTYVFTGGGILLKVQLVQNTAMVMRT